MILENRRCLLSSQIQMLWDGGPKGENHSNACSASPVVTTREASTVLSYNLSVRRCEADQLEFKCLLSRQSKQTRLGEYRNN